MTELLHVRDITQPWESHDSARWQRALDVSLVLRDPVLEHREIAGSLLKFRMQQQIRGAHRPYGKQLDQRRKRQRCIISDRDTRLDNLLRAHEPANPKSRATVRFRQGTEADGSLVEQCGIGQRRTVVCELDRKSVV